MNNQNQLLGLYRPFKMRIYYSLMNPKAGLQCVMPVPDIPSLAQVCTVYPHKAKCFWQQDINNSTKYEQRWPHMFTCNEWEAARLWMPCAEKCFARSTWDFEFHIPRTVRDAVPAAVHQRLSEDMLSRNMLLVCTGELVEQCIHPLDSSKSIFKYVMDKKATASSIAWSIGPYEMIEISGWKGQSAGKSSTDRNAAIPNGGLNHLEDEADISGFAFCLPGYQDELRYTVNTNKFVGQVRCRCLYY